MLCGFLSAEEYRASLEFNEDTTLSSSNDRESESETQTVNDDGPCAQLIREGNPVMDLDVLDKNRVPPHIRAQLDAKHDDRTRVIFSDWLRPPDVRCTRPHYHGKETSNGLPLWGATLYDFYAVPQPTSMSFMSGSLLVNVLRDMGELDSEYGRGLLPWASRNEYPRELNPYPVATLINDQDWSYSRSIAPSMKAPAGNALEMSKDSSGEIDSERSSDSGYASAEPGASGVKPLKEHSSWQLNPFSGAELKLEKRIPLHLLPRKLVVHDPYNALNVKSEHKYKYNCSSTPWNEMRDVTRSYSLRLFKDGKNTVEKEKKVLTSKAVLEPQRLYAKQVRMIVDIVPPSRPPPNKTPLAHLFLSPQHREGHGHHSVVYKASWEIPRQLVVDDVVCAHCLLTQGLQDLYDHLKASASSDVGSEAQSEGITRDRLEYLAGMLRMLREMADPNHEDEDNKIDPDVEVVTDMEGIDLSDMPPGVSVFRVRPKVPWRNPSVAPYCPHSDRNSLPRPAPSTATVYVAAKLSFQYDQHLEREARNYQSFPSHFFEHWNGYNLVPPLNDPVPVGAVVPQFYGYYVPDFVQDESTGHSDDDDTYLSPILLLESCGTPIDPAKLSRDDAQECASLLFKFHRENWVHNSLYERNILVQPGPLTEFPMFRHISSGSSGSRRSFRLIDFGRSVKRGPGEHTSRWWLQRDEHEEALSLLRINEFRELDENRGFLPEKRILTYD